MPSEVFSTTVRALQREKYWKTISTPGAIVFRDALGANTLPCKRIFPLRRCKRPYVFFRVSARRHFFTEKCVDITWLSRKTEVVAGNDARIDLS